MLPPPLENRGESERAPELPPPEDSVRLPMLPPPLEGCRPAAGAGGRDPVRQRLAGPCDPRSSWSRPWTPARFAPATSRWSSSAAARPRPRTRHFTVRSGEVVRLDYDDMTAAPAADEKQGAGARLTVRLPEEARLYVDGAVCPHVFRLPFLRNPGPGPGHGLHRLTPCFGRRWSGTAGRSRKAGGFISGPATGSPW